MRGYRGLPGGDTLVRLLRRERGRADRRGQRKEPASRRREAVRLRAQSLTLAEIGRRLGVSRQAVSQMLRQAEREEGEVKAAGNPT
jgi:DNA-binding transcriptional regulator LsrR (DeoR family)